MFRKCIGIALTIATTSAFAWDTPKEAVEKYVLFDLNGGRLSSNGWEQYVANYVYVPENYEEPGWDTAVVVEGFSVGEPECDSDKCTVAVTYQLYPTKSLNGPPVVPHETGGTEILKFSVLSRAGVWKVDPNPDNPRISIEQYRQH